MKYDVFVIGAGPGGYHAAIRASQLGLKVAIAEKQYWGGVCLNVGCMPTKALLHVGQEVANAKHASEFGLNILDMNLDLKVVNQYREKIVKKLSGGITNLLKANNVTALNGEAKIISRNSAIVTSTSGQETIEFDQLIVASGGAPNELKGFAIDGVDVVDSTSALLIPEKMPARFLCIGGGVIGLEFATIYNRLGSTVKVVEFMDRFGAGVDEEVMDEALKAFQKQGIIFQAGIEATGFTKKSDGLHVTLKNRQSGAVTTEIFDRVLVSTGRHPVGTGLGLEEIGVRFTDRGAVDVNAQTLETSVKGVYAIGDVVPGAWLAHKAMKDGLVAAERCAGKPSINDAVCVPGVIYTTPEIAWVGPSEKELREKGYKIRIGKFPVAALGRALTLGNSDGMIKMIADEETDLILAVHVTSPGASDIISEAALALEMGAVVNDIALTIHPHPTLGELMIEAAENVHKHSIHILNR